MTDDASQLLQALSPEYSTSEKGVMSVLSSYGLVPRDPNREQDLYDPKYMYNNLSGIPANIDLIFFPSEIFLRSLLERTSFVSLIPFLWYSKRDGNIYLAFKPYSMAFGEVKSLNDKLLEKKVEFERKGFIFPLEEH